MLVASVISFLNDVYYNTLELSYVCFYIVEGIEQVKLQLG